MLKLIYPPRHYFFDSGGKPLIGGYIEYDGLIYQDVFQTVPHQKRIWLDEHGSALLYIDDDCELHLYNRHGDFIETKMIPAQHEWVFFYDKFGQPLKYGKVWVYRFRSTILKNSFNMADKSVLNTNPVLLDGDGKAKIYIDGAYRLKVYNADDVLIADEDVYALPTPIEYQYILTSRKYPQFKSVDLILTSRIYPQFKPQDLILTSRKYPHWVEQSLVLTSQNYPYVDNEILNIHMKLDYGEKLFFPVEIMNISAVFAVGEIKSIVGHYYAPDEYVALNAIFVSGEIERVIKSIYNEDKLNISTLFMNGASELTLIRHNQPQEDKINLQAIFLSGEIE